MDSNPGPLVSEATTLPTVPHSLPYYLYDILDTKLPRNRLNFPAMKLILKKMPHNITDNIVKQLSLIGTPLKLEFKDNLNPFKDKKNQLTDRQVRHKQRLMKRVKRRGK